MTREEWNSLKKQFQILDPSWNTWAVLALAAATAVLSFYLSETHLFVLRIFSWVLLTAALLHIYLVMHEATHAAVSRNKWVNDLVGHLTGFMITMPYLPRLRSHLLHHIWTGHPTGDPANRRLIQKFSVMTPEQAAKLEGVWGRWIPALVINDRIGLWRDPFIQKSKGAVSSRITKEIRANYSYFIGYILVFAVLIGTHRLGFFASWYLPSLLGLFFLEELVNLPHHAESPLLNDDEKALPYWEQYRVTHSCKTIPVWSKYILLNFNLHTAHHLFPWVPWNYLPQVHREVIQRLPFVEKEQQTLNELNWSLTNRRRPLLQIMGHYFDKVPKPELDPTQQMEEFEKELSISLP